MIELRDVTKEYSKGNAALNGVSVKIKQGEFVFIVGDSGSGKSTLIRLIMKELEPTEGTIIVNGQNLKRMKHRTCPGDRTCRSPFTAKNRVFYDRNNTWYFFKILWFDKRDQPYEMEIAKKYCELVLSSKQPYEIPLLIPELRYGGLQTQHRYRLDFTIINPYTL